MFVGILDGTAPPATAMVAAVHAAITPSRRKSPQNRLRELRKQQGLTQQGLAARTGVSYQQIGHLERGEVRMDFHHAEILSRALLCSPFELMADAPRTVPVTLAAAAAFHEDRPDRFDLPEPHARVQVTARVAHPERCIAAHLVDDSADQLYPPDSLVIVRTIGAGERVKLGAKVLVRHFVGSRAEGETMEVLVGRLDLSVTGDLQLQLASHNRQLRGSLTIQTPARLGRGLGERYAAMLAKPEFVEWQPRDDDMADIIGVVVLAITPEE